MNVIFKEKISEQSDTGVAENITLLPGISIERDKGEGIKLIPAEYFSASGLLH